MMATSTDRNQVSHTRGRRGGPASSRVWEITGEPVHVFNNYYLNNELYGVATTMNAGVLVEGNYFENVPFPILVG